MSVTPKQKKSFMDNFILVVIAISVLVLIAGLSVVFFSDELAEEGFFGEGKLDYINFETADIQPGDDHYLACPEYYCSNSTPDETAPIYPVQANVLRDRLIALVDRREDISLKKMDLGNLDFIFLNSTPSEPFPDVVNVKIYDLGGAKSSIAIYSRTIKGDDDDGRNKKRVELWLSVLEQP